MIAKIVISTHKILSFVDFFTRECVECGLHVYILLYIRDSRYKYKIFYINTRTVHMIQPRSFLLVDDDIDDIIIFQDTLKKVDDNIQLFYVHD
jgi:hypothetical protein